MVFEVTLYLNEMSIKTEKVIVNGTSFSTMDTMEGSLFIILGPRSVPALVVPKGRLHSMRLIEASPKKAELRELVRLDKKEVVTE